MYREKIPSNPTVNANSDAWLARLGELGLGKFQFAENAAGLSKDYSYPIYPMSALVPGAVPVKIHCTETWGTCKLEGKTVYLAPSELPEDSGAPGDGHMTFIDSSAGKEDDLFVTHLPAKNGVLTIDWGGTCNLDGSGADNGGCSATAASTPLSLGIIRANDLLLAIKSPVGSLPYALQVGTKCSNGVVPPAINGDGHTPGCAPQGSRVYLAMHDTEVDATTLTPIAKAILRTIDEDHYGMILTDTNGGEDGFSLQCESGLTYTAFGKPDPWTTLFVPEAKNEGLNTKPYKDEYYIPLPLSGVDLAGKLKFL
jgi:hypothetical protein